MWPTPRRGSEQFVYELTRQVARVTEHLYLCSAGAAEQTSKLMRLGIGAEVNATPHLPFSNLQSDKLRIAVSDLPTVQISRYFNQFVDFVEKQRIAGKKVLVYCECGVSRSVTLCLVYLVARENMRLYDAFSHIKSLRGIANPNEGFWKQLMDWEFQKTRRCTVSLNSYRPGQGGSKPFYSHYGT